MNNSRFHELTIKYLAKTATEEELHELEIYLLEYPQQSVVFSSLKGLQSGFKKPEDAWTPQNTGDSFNRLWENIKEIEGKDAVFADIKTLRPIRFYRRLAIAATFISLIGLGLVFYRIFSSPQNVPVLSLQKIYVPNGKTRSIVLSDGSKVKLNAGSTLFYPVKFTGNSRRVELSGEGYFEVQKNPDKPFLVTTGNITVKVLGTVFNVKAYKGEKSTETTLIRGKVQVQLNHEPEKKILLSPNEKLIVVNLPSTAKRPKKQEVQKMKYQVMQLPVMHTLEETAWINHKLIFTDETFEDVARQMERKYDVSIQFDDLPLKSEHITGVLESENLEQALQILNMTTPFFYTRNEHELRISGRKNPSKK